MDYPGVLGGWGRGGGGSWGRLSGGPRPTGLPRVPSTMGQRVRPGLRDSSCCSNSEQLRQRQSGRASPQHVVPEVLGEHRQQPGDTEGKKDRSGRRVGGKVQVIWPCWRAAAPQGREGDTNSKASEGPSLYWVGHGEGSAGFY